MYRKITNRLLEWRQRRSRKPMILQGARQVGKTYSILDFGARYYENTAYFNFETNPGLADVFSGDISPEYLLPTLSRIAGRTLSKGTLIVFDEVQLCERALTSLKYFCENTPEYSVAAVGSLLGAAVNRRENSFPVGKVDLLTQHPMDMEEFLLARGEAKLAELIREHFEVLA